ncbi:MAG TPA: PH domain-containing protein [Bryobacteraceae bacterium]|nr:PH domain-containing protein [Bryobacteraceae bacterium]HPQ15089.1 PH domain-containing protein [Bryobacteraceae bacterium]
MRDPWAYAASAILFAVVVGFIYPQYYETNPDCLLLRAGLRRIRIPYSHITAVRPTFDMRSSVAMSLDRVLIEYQNGWQLIAPKDKVRLIEDVQTRAPQLSRRGQGLVLTASIPLPKSSGR